MVFRQIIILTVIAGTLLLTGCTKQLTSDTDVSPFVSFSNNSGVSYYPIYKDTVLTGRRGTFRVNFGAANGIREIIISSPDTLIDETKYYTKETYFNAEYNIMTPEKYQTYTSAYHFKVIDKTNRSAEKTINYTFIP